MKVDEFVATSLEQIVEGVRRAQQAVDPMGGQVNPHYTSGMRDHIEFDLAVTVEESTKTAGELGVSVWAVKAGTGGASENRNASVSRLRFKVPVAYPIHHDTIARNKK